MKIGLVGLPRSGKTSLFNLLTSSSVPTSFGGARAEMHVGVARVLDVRVDRLSALFRPRKTTYASFEVVDLAGIAKGERQGLEAKEFRNADALLHVVRAFPDAAGAAATPAADIGDLETELILADLEVVERRLERLEAAIKKRPTDAERREQEVLRAIMPALEAETPIRALDLADDAAKAIRGFTFLSQKPILHCLNLDEKELARAPDLAASFGLGEIAARARTRLGWVSAVIEAEVAQLAGEEQAAFLADLGLAEPAITRVLEDCYALLGLIAFFTVGDDEVRAWPVPRGTRAQDAAHAIHSDIARGFIRAEVVGYDELLAAEGSMSAVRERGQFRLEGKEYLVEDGEICHFRFNVAK
ncbi:MAG: YchF family ATPase [Candidatus Rokubacteria bacterium]|nr:YchF family ATPase [Candidatus Rokubacteria bacterium]